MKLSTSLSALLVILPFISEISAVAVPRNGATLIARQRGGGFGRNRGGNNNNNNNNNNNAGNNAGAVVDDATADDATADDATAVVDPDADAADDVAAQGQGNGNNNNNGGNNNADADPQTSLTLDPAVIAPAFANDGQDVPVDGQVASLTTTNNFINFCLTVDLPITNGQQVETGSCNVTPMGVIPAVGQIPSSKFTFPANGAVIQSDTQFTATMALSNLQAGNFVNAQQSYYAAPQQLNGQGVIIGHTHFVIEEIASLDSTEVTNPQEFIFFKGVNGAAVNGIVSADVTDGVPAGFYRLCSINTAANHQPVLAPIAQHGMMDDCIYFEANAAGEAADAGNNAGNGNAAGNGGNGGADDAEDDAAADPAATDPAAADPAASSDAADAADPVATDVAAGNGNNNQVGAGNNGGGRGGRGGNGRGGGRGGRNNRRRL